MGGFFFDGHDAERYTALVMGEGEKTKTTNVEHVSGEQHDTAFIMPGTLFVDRKTNRIGVKNPADEKQRWQVPLSDVIELLRAVL